MTAHIAAQRTEHQIPVAVSCRALGVSESWFYKHWNRDPTPGEDRQERLDADVKAVFEAHDGEYGSPRVHAELVDDHGWEQLSVNTVAASMQRQGLRAKVKPRRRSLTRPDPAAPKFENLLKRDFNPPAPNVAWCGDITEIQTWEGKLYLATVIDLYSRRLLGFAIAEHCRAELVCDALRMAVAVRGGPGVIEGVTFHSDRGTQYTAHEFTGLCEHFGIIQSMSRSGSCLDNAVAEAWFSTLKTELVYRVVLPTKAGTRRRLIAWIDRYNRTRRHSHCGLRSPITYETLTTPAARPAA